MWKGHSSNVAMTVNSDRPTVRQWLSNVLYKAAPSVILEFNGGDPKAESRYPKWNLGDLYKMAEGSWVLQEMYRVIIQEVMRVGWDIEPKYGNKCTACGSEFEESDLDECPMCEASTFKKPDPKQLVKARRLLDVPNSSRQTFRDILSSILYHDLVADDWYISVAYAPVKGLKSWRPKEIFVENPVSMHIVETDRGQLGSPTRWFCPICYPDKDSQEHDKPGKCRICGIQMDMVTYEQKIGNESTNLFGIDQMVRGSTYKLLPYSFGSPRMVSIWEILHIMRSMDAWFYDTYKTGRVAQIINFPGYTPDQVKSISTLVKQKEQELASTDPIYGDARPERKLKSLFLGSAEPIGVYPIMPDPTQMSALDYYRMIIQGIAGVYGIQVMFVAMSESGGRAGGGAMGAIRVEVQNRTIERIQKDKEDAITNQLFPIFGITDYKFVFNDLEKKDELRDAQIMQIKSNTALTYVNGGFDVSIDEDGDLKVSGEGERAQTTAFGEGRPSGETVAKPKESGTSRREIKGTTTERKPYGPKEGDDKK